MSDLNLASEFPPASEDDWLRRVAETLRGRPFDSLVSQTLDSIKVKPLYRGAAAAAPVQRPAPCAGERPWTIVQRVDLPDLAGANRQSLEDLENGAGGLALVFPGAVTAGEHGVPLSSEYDLRRLTGGVALDLIAVRLDAGRHWQLAAHLLLAVYDARGLDLARCNVALGLDPLGAFAQTGSTGSDAADRLAAIMTGLAGRGHSGPAILADTRVYHGTGCSEAQELAFALATAVQYLRWLESHRFDAADGASRIGFLLTADTDQFLTIGKLRAARLIWARLQSAMGVEPSPLALHVETAMRMMSRRDPHVNLLRTTAAAFAAGVGGADSVTVLPFTAALGLPDGFARRLARNIQTILQEESGIGTVGEAAAGSGYVEAMTAELAGEAWRIFQSIEARGGMLQALVSGVVQGMVAETAGRRRHMISERGLGLTGVSEFPSLDEAPVNLLHFPLPQRWLPAADEETNVLVCQPLHQSRLAEPFEALRDAADAHRRRTGNRPAVFLANLGRPSDFNARATWIRNLLASGGISGIGDEGFATGAAAGHAFASSRTRVACICSSDAVYAEFAAEAARSLKTAGAAAVYLAGPPGERAEELRAAGVDEFLVSGMDVVGALDRLHKALGIASRGA